MVNYILRRIIVSLPILLGITFIVFLLASLMPRPPGPPAKPATPVVAKDGSQTLWLLKDGTPVPLRVNVLGSNGQLSEVRPADGEAALEAGAAVIVEATARR